MYIKFLIFSVTRGSVEGNSYSNLWARSEDIVNTADSVGQPPMKLNCNPDLVDKLRGKLPGIMNCTIKTVSAGGAKGGIYVVDANPDKDK